jgi:hypothetical protein
MASENKGECPRWPQLFAQRRKFSLEAENQPYIAFLQTLRFEGEEYEEEGEEEEGVSHQAVDGNNHNGDDAKEEKPADGQGSGIDDDRSNGGNKNQDLKDNSKVRCSDGSSKVRLFMRGLSGEEVDLHRDQLDEIASTCEQAGLGEDETVNIGKDRKHVALLDDRNIRRTAVTNKGISPSGEFRPYLGPLTAESLGKELSKKVL